MGMDEAQDIWKRKQEDYSSYTEVVRYFHLTIR